MKPVDFLGKKFTACLREAHPALFCRDDDAGLQNEGLFELAALLAESGTPLCLGVVPAALDNEGIDCIGNLLARHPRLIELHQHGWQHKNHGGKKKHEFGPVRGLEEQQADIRNGWKRLKKLFGENVFAAFSPPWNRADENTITAVETQGFRVLSRALPLKTAPSKKVMELPVSVDLYDWKNRGLKSAAEIRRAFQKGLEFGEPIGILTHHAVMDEAERKFLGKLLEELQKAGLRFYTFSHLVSRSGSF